MNYPEFGQLLDRFQKRSEYSDYYLYLFSGLRTSLADIKQGRGELNFKTLELLAEALGLNEIELQQLLEAGEIYWPNFRTTLFLRFGLRFPSRSLRPNSKQLALFEVHPVTPSR